MKWILLRVCLVFFAALLGITVALSAENPKREWEVYQGKFYSFKYPAGWKVTSSDHGHSETLLPLSDDSLSDQQVNLAYAGFEIDEDEDLETWYKLYY